MAGAAPTRRGPCRRQPAAAGKHERLDAASPCTRPGSPRARARLRARGAGRHPAADLLAERARRGEAAPPRPRSPGAQGPRRGGDLETDEARAHDRQRAGRARALARSARASSSVRSSWTPARRAPHRASARVLAEQGDPPRGRAGRDHQPLVAQPLAADAARPPVRRRRARQPAFLGAAHVMLRVPTRRAQRRVRRSRQPAAPWRAVGGRRGRGARRRSSSPARHGHAHGASRQQRWAASPPPTSTVPSGAPLTTAPRPGRGRGRGAAGRREEACVAGTGRGRRARPRAPRASAARRGRGTARRSATAVAMMASAARSRRRPCRRPERE